MHRMYSYARGSSKPSAASAGHADCGSNPSTRHCAHVSTPYLLSNRGRAHLIAECLRAAHAAEQQPAGVGGAAVARGALVLRTHPRLVRRHLAADASPMHRAGTCPAGHKAGQRRPRELRRTGAGTARSGGGPQRSERGCMLLAPQTHILRTASGTRRTDQTGGGVGTS
jgi:hypothetical protein